MNRVSPTASSDSSTSSCRFARDSCLCRSGSSTLLRTVAHGISERLYSWKTSASSSGGPVTGFPCSSTRPRLGCIRPPMHFEQRRLAAAGRPDHAHELAGRRS